MLLSLVVEDKTFDLRSAHSRRATDLDRDRLVELQIFELSQSGLALTCSVHDRRVSFEEGLLSCRDINMNGG